MYSKQQKEIALKLYHQTESVSEIVEYCLIHFVSADCDTQYSLISEACVLPLW